MTKQIAPAIWKLIIISSMAPFFILFPQEALPEIKILFHTINNAAEIVITTLLLGYGIGALIHAPIANRFGRKSAMVAGFILSIIGITLSIASIPSHSFLLMNIGRTITGIGSGSGLVISMVMMNETHTAQRSQQLFSLVVPFFAFSPALGMALGGLVMAYLNIYWLFIIMGMLSILSIIVILSLQETLLKENQTAIKAFGIIKSYAIEFKNPKFICLILILTVGQSSMYVFNTISNIISTLKIHTPALIYGEIVLIPSCGLFIGAAISYFLKKKLGSKALITLSLSLILTVAIIMSVLLNFIPINIWILILPAASIFIGSAIIIPNAAMKSLQVSKNPAIGSSIITSCSLILTSLYVSLITSLTFLGAYMIPAAIITLCLIAFISLITI